MRLPDSLTLSYRKGIILNVVTFWVFLVGFRQTSRTFHHYGKRNGIKDGWKGRVGVIVEQIYFFKTKSWGKYLDQRMMKHMNNL